MNSASSTLGKLIDKQKWIIRNVRRDYPIYQLYADYKTPIRSVKNEYAYGSMLRSQIQQPCK